MSVRDATETNVMVLVFWVGLGFHSVLGVMCGLIGENGVFLRGGDEWGVQIAQYKMYENVAQISAIYCRKPHGKSG